MLRIESVIPLLQGTPTYYAAIHDVPPQLVDWNSWERLTLVKTYWNWDLLAFVSVYVCSQPNDVRPEFADGTPKPLLVKGSGGIYLEPRVPSTPAYCCTYVLP